jgi:hypothetical protein
MAAQINFTTAETTSTPVAGNALDLALIQLDSGGNNLILGNGTALNIYAGTYTPTLTNIANVAASVAFICQYMRIGAVVTVSGICNITPTAAAGTLTELDITLPVASALTSPRIAGTGFAGGSSVNGAAAVAYSTTSTGKLRFYAGEIAARSWNFHFTYLVA